MVYYKNNNTGEIVEILYSDVAGMCNRTLGLTMVVYSDDGHIFAMEHREFYNEYSKINKL